MIESTMKKRPSISQRLEFIDFTLYWSGGIQRGQVKERFGVSIQQASADLAAYQELAPKNLQYDLSAKRYISSDKFKPVLFQPSADKYLAQLNAVGTGILQSADTWIPSLPPLGLLPLPSRRVEPLVLRALLAAINNGSSVEIRYKSMNAELHATDWRRVTPHAFGSDGTRWHVRAYCHRGNRFKDFILSRCFEVKGEDAAGAVAADDKQWNELFTVTLGANPLLSPSQKLAIEHDYNMTNGAVAITVRNALLYYFDKRMRLDVKPDPLNPKSSPLAVINFESYESALSALGARK